MTRIRAFLLSFFLTAGILVPLLACIVMLQSQQVRKQTEQEQQVQAGAGAKGIPIALPTPDDRLTCFAAIRHDDKNFFLLMDINAVKNQVSVLGFPPQTVLLDPQGGTTTLDEEFVNAGPGRAAERLSNTLQIEIPHYLSSDSQHLAKACARLGEATVNLSDYDIPGIYSSVGKAPVCTMVAEQVFPLLEEWKLSAQQLANLLGNIAGEFLMKGIENDPTALSSVLKDCSSHLLTTLTSQEFLQLDRICKLMNGKDPTFTPHLVPGAMRASRFELSEDAISKAQELFESLVLPENTESSADSATVSFEADKSESTVSSTTSDAA